MKKFNDKLNHWIASHEIIATILVSLICCGAYSFFFRNQFKSPLLLIMGNVFVVYLCWRYVSYRKYAIINKAFDALDRNCDPYPLIEETTLLLRSMAHSKDNTQMFIMYQHNALSHSGEYDRAYAVLETMQPEKMSKKFVESMVILKDYYMFTLCDKMGRNEEAEQWYQKMEDAYSAARDPLTATRVGRSIENARVINMCRNGEFDEAIEIMDMGKAETNLTEVLRSMRYARIYLGKGDTDRAREKLEYVAENGGKLYYVEKAKELLTQLNHEENNTIGENTNESETA